MSSWLDLSGTANNFKRSYFHGFVDVSGGNVNVRNNDKLEFYDATDAKKFSINSDAINMTDSGSVSHTISTDKLQYIKNLTQDVESNINGVKSATQNLTATTASNTLDKNLVMTTGSKVVSDLSGNATSSDKLKNPRLIGGEEFDGTQSITLKGVDKQGDQNTTGTSSAVTNASQPNVTTLDNLSSVGTVNNNIAMKGGLNLAQNLDVGGTLTLGTPLSLAQGGTGATTSAALLTSLGLASTDTPEYANVISGEPTQATHAATKAYVDGQMATVDPAGTDNSVNVTLKAVNSNYLTLSGQEIEATTVPLVLGGTGATDAATAKTNLG